jgi:hypothetical protein
MQQQNLKNHSRMVPMFHYVTFLLILAVLIGSIVNMCRCSCENFYSALLITILTTAVILTTWYARSFALRAQDRTIKTEENFRHYILAGKTLPAALTISQIIALRFSCDEEWLNLMQKAIDEKLSSKEIKQLIKNWRGDYYRV